MLLSGHDPKDAKRFREGALALQKNFLDADKAAPENKSTAPPRAVPEPKEERDNPPLKFSLQLKRDIPFLLEEKRFTPEIIETFDVGWCPRGMFAGRVVVPIHNAEGKLVAYAGRGMRDNDIQKRGRWLFPKDFRKSLELFNLHRIKAFPAELLSRGVAIAEGFWSVMRLHAAGIPAVGLMGNSLSDRQLALLQTLNVPFVLTLDYDDTGREATTTILPRLCRAGFTKNGFCNPDILDDPCQPEDLSVKELRTLMHG